MFSRWADYPPSEQARTQAASLAMTRSKSHSIGSQIKDFISAFSGQEPVGTIMIGLLRLTTAVTQRNSISHPARAETPAYALAREPDRLGIH